jgi:glycerol-3-phosphate dehydrogenase (NAD(P)+)
MKAAVIGDGGWGTALALILNENGHDVTVWGAFPDYVKAVRDSGQNSEFLPGIDLPDSLNWTSDRQEAADGAELVVMAVPTKFYRQVAESFSGIVPQSCTVVSVAKGFDRSTRERMTEVAASTLGCPSVAALSGPSHAEEVARGVPTAVTVASTDAKAPERVTEMFSNERFRVYTVQDVIGVELGGALKNVIAVAAGVSDGVGWGDNTKAALMTRGLAEISRLGVTLGAERATFAGLSGMGDLIVTCASQLSRNRAAGERLGRGESMETILGDGSHAVEGLWNCGIVKELAADAGVDVPITDEVYAVAYEGKDPTESVRSLMTRAAKPETE